MGHLESHKLLQRLWVLRSNYSKTNHTIQMKWCADRGIHLIFLYSLLSLKADNMFSWFWLCCFFLLLLSKYCIFLFCIFFQNRNDVEPHISINENVLGNTQFPRVIAQMTVNREIARVKFRLFQFALLVMRVRHQRNTLNE